jgi:glycosyltransferase involved in cell wall biosynthesis/hydroxymethylpyrimidine pyrophosphatase-like HAD family hydrolase
MHIALVHLHGLLRTCRPPELKDADSGGQIVYVLGIARGLARLPGVRLTMYTRVIDDPVVHNDYRVESEPLLDEHGAPLAAGVLIRLRCGPNKYLRKEHLWPFVDEFADRMIEHCMRTGVPDVLYTHYADAGSIGRQVAACFNVPLVHVGHSLGRVKRLNLALCGDDGPSYLRSWAAVDQHYSFPKRFEEEERLLEYANVIVASTSNERDCQYSLYDAFSPFKGWRSSASQCQLLVLSPGVDLARFRCAAASATAAAATAGAAASSSSSVAIAHRGALRTLLGLPPADERHDEAAMERTVHNELARFLREPDKPCVMAMARLVKTKNLPEIVEAYGQSPRLQQLANLVLIMGQRETASELGEESRDLLVHILHLIDKYNLYGKVAYPKKHLPEHVPLFYRFAEARGGVFVNMAVCEPFGLTVLEAAASGVPVVVCDAGGPRDVVSQLENGLLVSVLPSADDDDANDEPRREDDLLPPAEAAAAGSEPMADAVALTAAATLAAGLTNRQWSLLTWPVPRHHISHISHITAAPTTATAVAPLDDFWLPSRPSRACLLYATQPPAADVDDDLLRAVPDEDDDDDDDDDRHHHPAGQEAQEAQEGQEGQEAKRDSLSTAPRTPSPASAYPNLVGACEALLTNTQLWKQCATSGCTRVTSFDWGTHAMRLHTLFEDVTTKHGDKWGKPVPASVTPASAAAVPTTTGVLVLDLDGRLQTAASGEGQVVDPALKQLRHSGWALCYTTGRTLRSACQLVERLGLPVPDVMVSSLGTAVHYHIDPQRQRDGCGPGERAQSSGAACWREDDSWRQHIDYRWKSDTHRRKRLAALFRAIRGFVEQPSSEQTPHKYSLSCSAKLLRGTGVLANVRSELRRAQIHANVVISGNGRSLDIVPLRAGKGNALRHLACKWQVPLDCFVVANDAGNGRAMQRGLAKAVVMARHDAELTRLKERKCVYYSPHEGLAGVLDGLQHYSLLTPTSPIV